MINKKIVSFKKAPEYFQKKKPCEVLAVKIYMVVFRRDVYGVHDARYLNSYQISDITSFFYNEDDARDFCELNRVQGRYFTVEELPCLCFRNNDLGLIISQLNIDTSHAFKGITIENIIGEYSFYDLYIMFDTDKNLFIKNTDSLYVSLFASDITKVKKIDVNDCFKINKSEFFGSKEKIVWKLEHRSVCSSSLLNINQ